VMSTARSETKARHRVFKGMWKEMLTTTLGVYHNSMTMSKKLGSWSSDWRDWEWLISEDEKTIYHVMRHEISIFRWTNRNKYSETDGRKYHWLSIVREFPIRRADVTHNKNAKECQLQARYRHRIDWKIGTNIEFPRRQLAICNQEILRGQ
jgi:hypothetical protein